MVAKTKGEILFGQPTVYYDEKAKEDKLKYPISRCIHVWSYHFVNREYKQCVKCRCISYNPASHIIG